MITIKRVYEKPASGDGCRILIDRLWPRGVSKEEAHVELWLKDIAPSDRLRRWFSHDPKKFHDFRKKYESELSEKKSLIDQIRYSEKSQGHVTLLFGAKDVEHNNAVVLEEYIRHVK